MKGHFGAPVWVSAHSLNENLCFLKGNAGIIVFLRTGTSYNTTGWDPKATPRMQKQTRGGVLGGGGVSQTRSKYFQMGFEVLGNHDLKDITSKPPIST